MTLIHKNEILKITNITVKDNGTYECATSNQFQSEYSIYTLIVNGVFMKYYYIFRNKLFNVLILFLKMKFVSNSVNYHKKNKK